MRLLRSLLLALSVASHTLAQDASDIPSVKHEYQVRAFHEALGPNTNPCTE